MSRLIYVPQYPVKMRYSEWWLPVFTKEFENHFDEVIVLGQNSLSKLSNDNYNSEMFSPINRAIDFETKQINEYMNLELKDDDILFLSDISFPGIFCNVLYHKRPSKMFAFCHATSLNKFDYFESSRSFKFEIESSHAALFDKIFFGSQYSLDKTGWKNGVVTALPDSPKDLISQLPNKSRHIDIVSVCRINKQKADILLENRVEEKYGKIHRQTVSTWEEYSKLLSRSKVLLISSAEDTFNYTILDAIRCGCIPLAPSRLCFPEILPKFFRYDDFEQLTSMLHFNLTIKHLNKPLPKIICQDKIDNFFENIIKIMKKRKK